MISKILIACLVAYAAYAFFGYAAPAKRLVYVTPPKGVDEVEPIMTSFNCIGRIYGYYADMENECKYFHICHKVYRRDGTYSMVQSTFKCPNGTSFSQSLLNCDWDEFVGPCQDSDFDSNLYFTTPAPYYPTTDVYEEEEYEEVTTPKPKRKLQRKRGYLKPKSKVVPVTTTKKPIVKSIKKVAVKTTAKPVVQTTQEPIVQTTEKPVVQTTQQPIVQTTEKPVVQTTQQPIVQTTEKPAVQTTQQPAVQTSQKPALQTTEKSVVQTTVQPALETTQKPVVETTVEPEV